MIGHRPSTIDHRPSTIGHRPSTIGCWARLTLEAASWPLALLTLWASGPMWRYAFDAIGYPFQLDPIESKVLQHAIWLREGHPIYFALGSSPPWVVGNYPPLFPLLTAIGVNPNLPDFAWPRILTLLSTLLAGVVLAVIAWRATRAVALALLAAGLWWSTYEVYYWTPLCRADLPALALSAGGLLLGISSLGRWTWRRLLLTCLLFWLAWLTRQSQVLLPLALLLWMFLTDRRWAWRFLLVWAGGLAALLGLLCLLTGGQFWVLSVRDNANAWSFAQVIIWVRHLMRMWPAGLAALAIGGIGVRACERASVRARDERRSTIDLRPSTIDHRPSAIDCSSGVMAIALALNLLNVLATGKIGADKNYLLEPLWCLAGLLPLLWQTLASRSHTRTLARSYAFGLFTAAIVIQGLWMVDNPLLPAEPWHRGPWPNRDARWRPRISRADLRRDVEVEADVRTAAGPVLCEYGIYALRAGRDLIHEPFLMSELAREGKWDETPLLEMIRRREFAAIVTGDDLSTPAPRYQSATGAFGEAVRENYTLARTWPGVITLHLWRPRPPGSPPRPDTRPHPTRAG